MSDTIGNRRRGGALVDAILSAGWRELNEHGYAALTLENVAKRAGTSRPVLARRWRTRAELMVAILNHYLSQHPISVRSSGTLREELADFLGQLSERGAGTVHLVLFGMREFFDDTGSTYVDLREALRGSDVLDRIFERAIRRGELDARKLTSRVARVPVDLVRQETFQTGERATDDAIYEIIDEIFMPLVRGTTEA